MDKPLPELLKYMSEKPLMTGIPEQASFREEDEKANKDKIMTGLSSFEVKSDSLDS